jgi:hypothetical protein
LLSPLRLIAILASIFRWQVSGRPLRSRKSWHSKLANWE